MSETVTPIETPGAGSALLRAPLSALRGRLLALGVVDAAAGLLLIMLSWLLAETLSDLVFDAVEPAPVTLLAVVLLLALRFVLLAASAHLAADIGIRAGMWLRRCLSRALVDSRRGLTGPAPAQGEAALLLVDGVEAVEPFFARYLPAVIQAVFLPVAILVVALPLDLVTALTLGLTAPLIPVFMVLIGKGAVSLNAAQWAAMTRLSAYFLDAVRALPVLRVFGALDREARVLAAASDQWRDGAFKVLRIAFLSSLALEFFATLGVALVAVFIGFRLLFGEMDYARGLFLLILAPEFYRPLRALGVQYHARMEATAACARLERLSACENASSPLEETPPSRPCPLYPEPERPPKVTIERVAFAYPGHGPVLKNVSLTLEPGSLTALVGASGAGKTTILDLLRGRLCPQAGRILIDDRPPDPNGARPVWIPQSPHPFAGSVRDAVSLGRPDATDVDLWRALRLADADAFVRARPGGLAGRIGEGGKGFSGGEIRRLALARAFLADASLVLLDEPSASLDQHSEAALNDALRRLVPGRTVLVCAHRLATIRAADRVLVLEDGRIVQAGTFDTLRGEDGPFRRLLGATAPLVAAAVNADASRGAI